MGATRNKFSPEFRDRAVRRVDEHRGGYPSEWAALHVLQVRRLIAAWSRTILKHSATWGCGPRSCVG